MLPYTPLHHLLLADAGTTLVMTSGNLSDEPIAYGDEDALSRLGGIADLYLLHDRPIETRTDDSVVRSLGTLRERPLIFRRARGYVPASVPLPVPTSRPLLAVRRRAQEHLLRRQGRPRMGEPPHRRPEELRDAASPSRRGSRTSSGCSRSSRRWWPTTSTPTTCPPPTRCAREGVEHVGVQHHHAHLAACLAEHGDGGPALGAIYDGTGYGTDGTVWGGELLVGRLRGVHAPRRASLPVPMPGGEAAVREPWRMACSWLLAAGRGRGRGGPGRAAAARRRWRAGSRRRSGGRWPEWPRAAWRPRLTSSMGRLFDAVAALCGLRTEVTYEGQAAIELEAVSDRAESADVSAARDGDRATVLCSTRARPCRP